MWSKLKYPIIGFCIPVNIILIIVGILMSNTYAIMLGLISLALMVVPLIGDDYAEKENDEEPEDKGPFSR